MKTFAKILCLSLVAVMLCATLASCAPAAKAEDALAALKENGYTAVKSDLLGAAGLAALGIKGVDSVVTGTKTETKDDKTTVETITIIYFTDANSAKTAEEKVTSKSDEEKKNNKDEDSNWVFKRSGKMIYFGTKAAVKAAR